MTDRENMPPLPDIPPAWDAIRAQMEALRLATWNAAIEAAAKKCEAEALHDPCNTADDIAYNQAVIDCASAIRSMKEPE